MQEQASAAVKVVEQVLGADSTLGIYLYGSAVAGGLRPDSDIDLLVVTDRKLVDTDRQRLVDGLVPISGRTMRPPSWRPMEVTVVAQAQVRPWRYPPSFEFQYGEWLREEFARGELTPWPATNPDLAVLITMVLADSNPLVGPPAATLLDAVPHVDLVRATVDELPQLMGDLQDDTRNVLLTLARMWSTVATGEIRSKDGAADWALERLPEEHRAVLDRARSLYLDGGYGEWEDEMEAARACARAMAERIGQAAAAA